MLVPLVRIYRHSHDRMPTDSSRESSLTVVAAPGSQSESPKRKYTEAMTLPSRLPTLNLDVPDIATDAFQLSEGKCDSPRSRVAEKLEALDIDQSAAEAEEDAPRKRMKTDQQHQPVSKLSRFDVTPEKLPRPRFDLPHHQHRPSEAVLEIAETPGCRPEVDARPSTPSPLAKQVETPMSKQNISPTVRTTPKRMRSPPPPMASPSSPDKSADGLSTTSPDSSQSSADVADTTWQDSEITGHHIHTALGDDGEGINGIGFRPTPAIAQARSQKRKHQLSEWRAREAKEARQRRYEKRQGCAVDAGNGDESQRRVVRFEEIG